MTVAEWIHAEGVSYLVVAVLTMGGIIGRMLVRRLDQLTVKVDELHADMIRLKVRLEHATH